MNPDKPEGELPIAPPVTELTKALETLRKPPKASKPYVLPTVGRIVHYFERGREPLAAIVTAVHDNSVDLHIFIPGTEHNMVAMNVAPEWIDSAENEDIYPYWAWPKIVG